MTRIMNGYFVASLLGPISAMSDEERDDAHKRVDPNDSVAVKRLIATVLKPEFDRYDERSQVLLRENLSYFLTVGIDHWNHLYESSMPPIDPPDDPQRFFLWLWEVLFHDQSYLMSDTSDVEAVNDIDGLKELRVKAHLLPS
jgi:hypothetical protein